MQETIDKAKQRLRQSFMGRAGIHALGLSRAEQAIRVYVDLEAPPDLDHVLEQLRKSAEPFAVTVIREDSPRLTGGAGKDG